MSYSYSFHELIKNVPAPGKYATETHLHIKGTSGCAAGTAEEYVPAYRDAGYSTLIVTNHYGPWSAMTTGKTGRAAIDLLKDSYEHVAEVGEKYGLTVLSGMEISFEAHQGDFLLYGFDWDFFYDDPEIFRKMPVEEFAPIAHENGFIIFQAHPCREGNTPRRLDTLDGIEIYNGQLGHHNNNDQAYALACEKGMRMLSGSDCHAANCEALGGILTDKKIETMEQFLDLLRRGGYTLQYDPQFFPVEGF